MKKTLEYIMNQELKLLGEHDILSTEYPERDTYIVKSPNETYIAIMNSNRNIVIIIHDSKHYSDNCHTEYKLINGLWERQ